MNMPLCPSKTWRWLLNGYNLKDLQVSNHKHPSINTHDSVTASKWQTSWEHQNQTASKASHFTWCTLQLARNGCWDAWLHTIRTHPDLVCVCGQRAQLEELDRVLFNSPSAQLLSYDTTFQLGDFYVSILCFRHTLFKEAPVILAAFLVHERKFEEHHKELFCVCTKLVRSLNHTTCPMVTDEEVAIVNAVAQVILKFLNCGAGTTSFMLWWHGYANMGPMSRHISLPEWHQRSLSPPYRRGIR